MAFISMEPLDDKTTEVLVLTPGAQIAQYKLGESIGAGGMAQVYLAEDTKLRRRIALKFLSPQLAADASFRARFIREAQSAAVLNHPNIITIYEVAEYRQRVFIAMEYVEGKSLRALMDSGGMSLDQAMDIALQVCDGLTVAHRAGVVHRDIKPGNAILGNDGRVRLLDFGLAKAEGDEQLTQTGTALGTVDYMSPEQGQGLPTDNRSDIFSVGILLYELATNHLPFRRSNMPATIHAIVHEDPPPMTDFVPGLPARIRSIIEKALEKKVKDRYQDVALLAADLRAALGRSHFSPGLSVVAPAIQPAVKSLAVLYLKNLGPAEDEYLSYGITEDLIVDLTRLGTMRVSPMRTILKYKDSDDDLEVIAEKLNATMVLDGSIIRMGASLRVSAQLVDAISGDNLWAERWEEPLDNLPDVKRSLAQGISHAVGFGMTQVRVAGVGLPEAKDAGAYDNYLKGKFSFDHKRDKSDVDIALGLYRQALKEEPSLLAARAGVAEILAHQGQFSAARIELESALEQATKSSQKADQASLFRLLAKVHLSHSAWDEAWKCASESLSISKELKDLAGEADSIGIQISILQPQARFNETLELFDRVLEIARDLEDQDQIGESLKNMGVAYSRKGDYERALGLYEEALELAHDNDNVSLQAACLANIGNLHFFQGDLDRALIHYTESLGMSERLGDNSGSARQRLNMGLVEFQRGELRSGLTHLHEASEYFDEQGERNYLAISMANIGQAELYLGEIEAARRDLGRALEIADEIKVPLAEAIAHQRLGTTYLLTDQPEEARKHYDAALSVASEAGLSRNECSVHLDLAKLALETNDLAECRKQTEKAQGMAREIGDKPALCISAAYLGLLTAREGLTRVGARQIERQLAVADKLSDIHIVLNVRSMLGEALYCYGDDQDKEKGELLLNETLALALEKEFVPEADRIKRLLASPKG